MRRSVVPLVLPRLLVVLTVLGAVLAAGLVVVRTRAPAAMPARAQSAGPVAGPLETPVVHAGGAAPPGGSGAVPRGEVRRALGVLHGWDARRARAWATGDQTALRSLYLHGSAAGRADLRLLAAYTARRLVVRRLVTQVFAVRVLGETRRSLRLLVLDRVAGGEVASSRGSRPLRSSPPASRTVQLRRAGGRWRVGEVSESERAPRAARHARRGR